MAERAVQLEGLDRVLAKLASLPAAAQREVDEVARQVAGVNALEIRNAAAQGSRQVRRASESVHAEGAAIVGGGPFFMGSMFGGQARPTTQQFLPFRAKGYWFWPTLKANFSETMDAFESVVDAIAREWAR